MSTAPVVTAISTTFSLLFLWAMVHWLYRGYRINLFRQRVFAVRDDLFDLARTGVISFDHPAYGLLRTTMNGFIRFGDRIGVMNLLLGTWGLRAHTAPQDSFSVVYEHACLDLTPDQRRELDQVKLRMDEQVIEQLILGSPLLVVTILPMVLLVMARILGEVAITKARLWWGVKRRVLDPLDSIALRAGAF